MRLRIGFGNTRTWIESFAGSIIVASFLQSAVFGAQPKVYVTIAMHNEENEGYHTNQPLFDLRRAAMVKFVDMLASNSVGFSFGPDWSFLRAVTNFDSGGPDTGGSNIIEYIKGRGFDVDPHAHETLYNYADVARLIEDCGVTPSHVASGLVAYPDTNCILTHFWQTITGSVYSAATWTPGILWGGSTKSHANETNMWVSGIWNPAGTNAWLHHSGTAPVCHIGGFGGRPVRWINLQRLLDFRDQGLLSTQHMYTCAIFLETWEVNNPLIADFHQKITQYKLTNGIEWVGFTEAAIIWDALYGSHPNVFPYMPELDSDEDGMTDLWELDYFEDMTHSDGTNDVDSDLMPDISEFVAGTVPTDTDSFLECRFIEDSMNSSTESVLAWNTCSGRVYSVHACTDLVTDSWLPVTSGLPYSPVMNTWTDSWSGPTRYYYIGVQGE